MILGQSHDHQVREPLVRIVAVVHDELAAAAGGERVGEGEQTTNRAGGSSAPRKPIVNKQPKVGRNDPCPCGSGKKYKKCHMLGDPQDGASAAAL